MNAVPPRHGDFVSNASDADRWRVGSWLHKGFRPFFWLAAVHGAVLVPLWLGVLAGAYHPSRYFDAVSWHAHEMTFGFSMAVIAGFLLTAVGNWTQQETAVGPRLGFLVVLWSLGRVSVTVPGIPAAVVAAVDLLFVPVLSWTVLRPIARSGNWRNMVMVVALWVMGIGNAMMHLDALGVWGGARRRGQFLALDAIVLVVVLISARVIPMFTRNGCPTAQVVVRARLSMAGAMVTALVGVFDVLAPNASWKFSCCLVAGGLVWARAVGWGTMSTARSPLLWVLHAGHAWLGMGLLLRGLSYWVPGIPESTAVHGLTVGAIGTLCVGMMSRVSLGHTGRPLTAPRFAVLSFVSISMAAVARVFAPLLMPQFSRLSIWLSGALWSLALVFFLAGYSVVLGAPRVDGKPG